MGNILELLGASNFIYLFLVLRVQRREDVFVPA